MADLVRVHNLGPKPLRIAYNSQALVVPGQGDAVMEREAACVHFGNWELRNRPEVTDPDIRDARTIEVARIRALYGKDYPSVEISEMDGTKVSTILDDPEGKSLPMEQVTDKDELLVSLAAQMKTMEAEIDRLRNVPEPQIAAPVDSPQRGRRLPKQVQAAGE